MRLSLTKAALGTAVIILSGCSNQALVEDIAERALEQAVGGDVDIDLDDEGADISVESSDGTFEQSFGNSVPDDFPPDVPLVDDFDVQHSVSMSDEENRGWSVTMSGSGSATDIAEQIKSDFADAGFSLTNENTSTNDDHVNATLFFESDTHTAIVGINEDFDAGETVVSYIVNEVDQTS